jgi:hypothetical protein
MAKVYVVLADHWAIAGTHCTVFPNYEAAIKQAAIEANALLKDAGLEKYDIRDQKTLNIAIDRIQETVGSDAAWMRLDIIEAEMQ